MRWKGFIVISSLVFVLFLVSCAPAENDQSQGISDEELFGSDAAITGAVIGNSDNCVSNLDKRKYWVCSCQEDENGLITFTYQRGASYNDKKPCDTDTRPTEQCLKKPDLERDYECVSQNELKYCDLPCPDCVQQGNYVLCTEPPVPGEEPPPELSQTAYIKASNTGYDDRFGTSLDLSGNTLVVGAKFEDSSAQGINGDQFNDDAVIAGATYVFVNDGTNWAQQSYLKGSNTEDSDMFGESVAISSDTVIVGATGEDSAATGVNGNQADNSAGYWAGAAYVFVRNNGIWEQQAYLKASNTGSNDYFGKSVAIDGDTVVVGAYWEGSGVVGDPNDNSMTGAGAAYVFVRNNGVWEQQAYLKASNPTRSASFGIDVAISGDTIIVGSLNDAAYVFVRNIGVWQQQAVLQPSNLDPGDGFGATVSISGEIIVVGSAFEDGLDNVAGDSGAAYVFVRNNGVWEQQAYLRASNAEAGDYFGSSVDISGEKLVVGSWEDSSATGVNGDQADNSADGAGAAYVFVRNNGVWEQQAYLKASNTETSDSFSAFSITEERCVAISGNTIAVGAVGEDSSATGINGDQNDNSARTSGAVYTFA